MIAARVVVATAAVTIPELRNYGRLDAHDHHEPEPKPQNEVAEDALPAQPIVAPAGDAG